MEKVIITLRGTDAEEAWCQRLRDNVAAELLDVGVAGLAVNLRDVTVRGSLMTLTTLDPPVIGFLTVWTQQCYGDQVRFATARLGKECGVVAAYLVTESVPIPPPGTALGERTPGLANISLLRRPPTSTRRYGGNAGTSTTLRWPSRRSRHSGTRRMKWCAH